jgi:hypothetical protein
MLVILILVMRVILAPRLLSMVVLRLPVCCSV